MTTKTAIHQVFAPGDDVLMTDMGDRKVLMSIEHGHFLELNPTGRAIWDRLDGTRSLAQIAEELHQIYGIEQGLCEADTLQFLEDLHDHRLVEAKS